MEGYNREMAERVWQRVQQVQDVHNVAEPVQDTQWLLDLITQKRVGAATYLTLSRRMQGKNSILLHRLFEEEQTHAACLRGIYKLITGMNPHTHSIPPAQEPAQVILRRCYGREMRCLALYEVHSADPEYGQVFARLAEQEREHCRSVLELLGRLQEKR